MSDRPGNTEILKAACEAYVSSHSAEKRHNACHYIVRTPDGHHLDIVNLHYWVHNSGLFDNPSNAYKRFMQIASTVRGTNTRRPLYSYLGYTIVSSDKGNLLTTRPYLNPPKHCKICGAELSKNRRSYCSDACAGEAHRRQASAAYKQNKEESN